jgi:curved DNA-binding protein CbpA
LINSQPSHSKPQNPQKKNPNNLKSILTIFLHLKIYKNDFIKMFSKIFRSFSSKDYYKILGITKTASKSEIRSAYLRLAKQYHPDSPTGNEEKFKELGEAWSVLGNETSKASYDSSDSSDFSSQGFHFRNPNYNKHHYYQRNEHEKWQEFYRKHYESKSSFQKDFDDFFENNTETSRKRQKKRTKYYEFYDPRTGKRYFYSSTTTQSNPDYDSQNQKIFDELFKKRHFKQSANEEEEQMIKSFSIASYLFGCLLIYMIVSKLMFPRPYPSDYYREPRQKRVWDEFEEDLNNQLRRNG